MLLYKFDSRVFVFNSNRTVYMLFIFHSVIDAVEMNVII